jgi:UTP-glucose-1-phosphate uridylyltransferase
VIDPPLTVVLPCAGRGSRLILPFPKELLPVGRGRLLIDHALELILGTGLHLRVLVLVDGSRCQTEQYVRSRLAGVSVATLRQAGDPGHLLDGVLETEPWWSEVNLVILPDQTFAYSTKASAVLSGLRDSVLRHGFCFLGARKPPAALVGDAGLSLAGEPPRVRALVDKPLRPDDLDAGWAGFAWSGRESRPCLEALAEAERAPGVRMTTGALIGKPVVLIEQYSDCGTWDQVCAVWHEA